MARWWNNALYLIARIDGTLGPAILYVTKEHEVFVLQNITGEARPFPESFKIFREVYGSRYTCSLLIRMPK